MGYIRQVFQRLLPNLIKVSHLSENQVHPAYQFQKLLTDRQFKQFTEWIHKEFYISELQSFVNGIKRDLEAVFRACKYPYSNGVAEASVNKTKLIKRIMFGRNNLIPCRNRFYHENSRAIIRCHYTR
ncbi:transposase [Bacillus cereus]|uniref:transposase n=1 Tax=Bacillus cereus TaxID=1396 RepID=UPI0009B54F39|nr:transposase [Bacillus cereus]